MAVMALLGSKCRCICLVGAGGIGKTALGVAVCHYLRLRHAFSSGVYQIDARGLSSVLQVMQARRRDEDEGRGELRGRGDGERRR